MVTVVPTLAFMADIYQLTRAGGPQSPRFRAYVERVSHVFGLAAYNPMAGPHALDGVKSLLALDAERIAAQAATDACDRLGHTDPVTLAVVLCAPGLWTDRVVTEITHRTTGARTAGHGLVLQWADESPTTHFLRRECVAETMRVIDTAVQGPADTLRTVLGREGRAYARAQQFVPSPRDSGDGEPARAPVTATAAQPLSDDEARLVEDALDMFGDSRAPSEIVAVAHGDEAARAFGYTPLGLPPLAGVRCAVAKALAEGIGARPPAPASTSTP